MEIVPPDAAGAFPQLLAGALAGQLVRSRSRNVLGEPRTPQAAASRVRKGVSGLRRRVRVSALSLGENGGQRA